MHEKIEAIVEGLGITVYRDFNDSLDESGEPISDNYIVWNYSLIHGGLYADDEPTWDICSFQIHWFVNANTQIDGTINQIKRNALEQEFTYPQVTILYESDTKLRHIILTTEISVEREV